MAVAPNGDLYIADPVRQQILAMHRNGRFTIVAGSGKKGFSGDGGPARVATLNYPGGMAVAKDGTLYFADEGNHRVRAISSSGRIRSVAGDGRDPGIRFVADRTKASQAAIAPAAVAFGPGGALYIAAGAQVFRMASSDRLTAVLGGRDINHGGITHVGGRAVDASADDADGVALDSHGALYVSGFATKALLVVVDGILHVPSKTAFYPRYVGGLATSPNGQVFGGDGTTVQRLSAHGVTPFETTRQLMRLGVGGFEVDGIAFAPNGTMYVDTYAGNGFSNGSAIAEITPSGQATLLWHS